MFSHVLVPMDFRFVPRVTLMTAAVLANEQGARLSLLYVSDISVDYPVVAVTAITDDVVKRQYDDVRCAFENALAIISEYGMAASTYAVSGFPVHEMIKRAAATMKADVIVMGTHGLRGLARAFRGSVTEQVLRDADVPVLAIHESPTMKFTPVSWEPYDSWTEHS
jgi:nucleotide-binding universal stress UspA family protein